MNRVCRCADVPVSVPAGRAPGAGYPIGYPITWPKLRRFACSVGVRTPTEARTISLGSRSLYTQGVGNRRPRLGGVVKGSIAGCRGGWLPVAPTNLLTSFPITWASTAPTDAVEGGGS